VLLVVAALSGTLRKFSRIDLLLGAIAFSAGYCLVALGVLTRWSIWLPGVVPLGAVWLAVLACFILPKPRLSTRTVAVAASPPTP
jgi:hypothetical protein